MELTVPYQNFLKYQAFTLYPNMIAGELQELVQTSTAAFGWAPIDPYVSESVYEFLNGVGLTHKVTCLIDVTRKFTQVGNPARIVTQWADAGTTMSDGTINITSGSVVMMRNNIAGYAVKPDVLNELVVCLRDPIIIPSQTLNRRHFAAAARPNGINTTTDISINNATNITVMFPKRASDYTCFDNIMCENVQLGANKQQYPDTDTSTVGDRFCQMQLVVNELDGTLEPTDEFEDSFTNPPNAPSGAPYNNVRSDGTSFGINFQLERSNAGYVFDGVDTGTQTVPITFHGKPIYSGDSDTYYNYEATKTQHPPPPELWICEDTYFTLSTAGLKYHGHTTPSGLA